MLYAVSQKKFEEAASKNETIAWVDAGHIGLSSTAKLTIATIAIYKSGVIQKAAKKVYAALKYLRKKEPENIEEMDEAGVRDNLESQGGMDAPTEEDPELSLWDLHVKMLSDTIDDNCTIQAERVEHEADLVESKQKATLKLMTRKLFKLF